MTFVEELIREVDNMKREGKTTEEIAARTDEMIDEWNRGEWVKGQWAKVVKV